MNSAKMRKLAFVAAWLASCGESVCDESARRFCQRVLGCNLIPDASFDACLSAKKKRMKDLGATDAQCANLQFEIEHMTCCQLASASGVTVDACKDTPKTP